MSDNTPTGGGYDLPDTSNVFTPEEASEVINRLDADSFADHRHPLSDGNHPQAGNFRNAYNALYRIKYQDIDNRPPLEQVLAKGLEIQAQQQAERTERTAHLIGELVGLGYDPETAPPDVLADEVALLEVQVQAAKHQWDEVSDGIRANLRGSTPNHVLETWNDYKACPESRPDEKLAYATTILRFLADEARARVGLPPRSAKAKEPEPAKPKGADTLLGRYSR